MPSHPVAPHPGSSYTLSAIHPRPRPSRPIPPSLYQRPSDGIPNLPAGSYRAVAGPPLFQGGHGQTFHFISTGPPKTRNRIRPPQLKRLEELYSMDTHPPTAEREELGREIGLYVFALACF